MVISLFVFQDNHLDGLVDLHRILEASVIDAEVEVHAGSSVIGLCDPERDKRNIIRIIPFFTKDNRK